MAVCKWLSDDFSEICVNGDCPVRADYCPVTNYPEICKYSEFEESDREIRNYDSNTDTKRAARRRYMAEYMKRYRASQHGQEVIQRQKDRAALRRAAELQAHERDGKVRP